MAQKSNQRKVSRLEVYQSFQDGYRANDALRVQGLQSLLTIRKKKAKLQERDKQRIEGKYGKDSEQLEVLEKNQKANLNFISGLGMEVNRARSRPEKVNPDTWIVQGRVYDRLGEPLAGAKVSLYSMDDRKVPKVSPATTDVNGKYKLSFKGEKNDIKDGASNLELLRFLGGTRVKKNAEKEGDDQQIRARINARQQASVFVRVSFGKKLPVTADSTPMVARPGLSHHRDIILNLDQYEAFKPSTDRDIRSTRYLGNSATRELHDLQNEKKGCQINKMRFDHMVNFTTIKMAQEADYDFCAYCFGKKKSRR